MTYHCKVKEQPTQQMLSIRTRVAVRDLPQVFGEGYGKIAQYLGELDEPPIGPPFAAYYNMDMENLDVELGFPVARTLPGREEIKSGEIVAGQVATCLHTGPYSGIEPAYTTLMEWMADNDGTLADPADGAYDDWFELYNPGTNRIDLGGYYLTDDLTDPFKFEVPNNGQYTIDPGGYLLVWADGDSGQNTTNRPDLHADFSLGRNGESIGIYGSDGVALDAVTFGEQTMDVSEGRYPDASAGIYVMESPTPRAPNLVGNTAPVLGAIDDATVSLGQTLAFYATAEDYDSPAQNLTFSLLNAPAGASIHATSGAFSWTPGSAPSTNTMAVVVLDNGTPALSDTNWFSVVVVASPEVSDFSASGDEVRFSWSSVSGQQYRVYYKDELIEVYWNPLGEFRLGTGDVMSYTNSIPDTDHRFYTIGLE